MIYGSFIEIRKFFQKADSVTITVDRDYKAMKKAGRIALNQIAGKEALEVLDALASSFVEGNDDSASLFWR